MKKGTKIGKGRRQKKRMKGEERKGKDCIREKKNTENQLVRGMRAEKRRGRRGIRKE